MVAFANIVKNSFAAKDKSDHGQRLHRADVEPQRVFTDQQGDRAETEKTATQDCSMGGPQDRARSSAPPFPAGSELPRSSGPEAANPLTRCPMDRSSGNSSLRASPFPQMTWANSIIL